MRIWASSRREQLREDVAVVQFPIPPPSFACEGGLAWWWGRCLGQSRLRSRGKPWEGATGGQGALGLQPAEPLTRGWQLAPQPRRLQGRMAVPACR